MPYREKIAWLSLLAMAAGFVPYFVSASRMQTAGLTVVAALYLFLAAVIRQIIVLIVGHIALRLSNRDDATAPADERDQAIQRRSIVAAYYVLMTGIILVGCVMPFTQKGWDIFNAAVFAILVAEAVHYGVMVVLYRRQA